MSTRNDEFRSNFGQRLKAARKHIGLNQGDFALRIGVSRDTVSRYERGDLAPSIEVLSSMVAALGPNMTADWLLYGSAERLEHPPIRLKRFGSLIGLGFDGHGTAEVSMGMVEVTRILEACIEYEKQQQTTNTKLIKQLKELRSYLYEYDSDINITAEVLIAVHAARIIPIWPDWEKEQRVLSSGIPIDEVYGLKDSVEDENKKSTSSANTEISQQISGKDHHIAGRDVVINKEK